MLPPGLYEQVINTALNRELSEIPDARKSVAPIDTAEASKVLAQYLADVVQMGLDNVLDNGGDISTQIGLANKIVDLIQNTTQAGRAASCAFTGAGPPAGRRQNGCRPDPAGNLHRPEQPVYRGHS